MNYSKIPRELICFTHRSLDHYDVDDRKYANFYFFEQMLKMDILSPQYKETESQILAIFNDAYFILTLVFLEKRPILRLGYYREIARIWPGGGVSLEREVIVLSLVFEILGLIKQELPHSVLYFKEELKRFLSAKKDYVDYFFSIKEDVYRYSITLFYPKKITKEVVNKIDWEDLTDNFDLETIQDIVDTLGRDNKEKLIIVEGIFEAEASTGNMAAIPYDVDKFLDKLHKKYDENHKGLLEAYDEQRESLNLDKLLDKKIKTFIKRETATDKDIDEIFDDSSSDADIEIQDQRISELENEVNQLVREKAEIEKQCKASRDKEEELRSENEKNKTECQRLLQLNGELEKQLHDEVIHSGDIIIAEDRKIDVIKVIHAMCKIGLFRLKNGKKFTIKAVMEYFGKVLNDNFSEYNSNLSTSKATTKEDTFLEVFDELRGEANKYLKKS
jgi:hypothetical protein